MQPVLLRTATICVSRNKQDSLFSSRLKQDIYLENKNKSCIYLNMTVFFFITLQEPVFPNHSNDLHTFWASQNHEWTYCYPLGKGNINYFMGGILKHTLILLNSLPNVKLEVKQKIEYRFPKSHLSTFNTVTPNLSRNEYLWFISGTSRFWWGWKFSNKKKKRKQRRV